MRRVAIGAGEQGSASALADAVAVIDRGGVVAIPTDTLYGLAVDPFSPTAISHLFAVKGRATERAVALVGADTGQVSSQLGALPPAARALAARYWPGPLTLLVERPASVPAELTGGSHLV